MENSSSISTERQSGSLEPNAILREVAPETAAQWLETNENNRNLRERLVEKLAGAMQRGEWRINGDTIRFDQNGKLVDGQHRLAAIVRAQVPAQTLVVEGIDREAQVTMDTGAKRTLADTLKLRGEVDVNVLASTLRMYWRYEHNALRWIATEPTHEELLTLLEDCPGLRDSVAATKAIKPLRASRTVASTAYYLFAPDDPAETQYFFDRLVDGVDLSADNPIRRLREWLITTAGTKTKYNSAYVLALYIKSWNAHIEGKPIKTLRWRVGGSNPESFPTPVRPSDY